MPVPDMSALFETSFPLSRSADEYRTAANILTADRASESPAAWGSASVAQALALAARALASAAQLPSSQVCTMDTPYDDTDKHAGDFCCRS